MKNKASPSILKDCAQNSLNRIRKIQNQIAALHYACKDIRENEYSPKSAKEDFSALHSELYSRLNDAYRDLFMFGVMSADEEMIQKAREAALNHFLSEQMSIMGYLNFDYSESYPTALEKRFREEIEDAAERFGIQKKKANRNVGD